MTASELEEKQKEMHEKIRNNAKMHGLIKQKPFLEPIYDGVADPKGYLETNPKIMWLLKEPYDDLTPSGKHKGGGWSFIDDIFNNTKWSDFWKSSTMWQLMIQINYAIHNSCDWKDLKYIAEKPEMADELKKTAYINLSKMPADSTSSDTHLWNCFPLWKSILLEQINLYEPDVIIFGNTFAFFTEILKINYNPIHTISGRWGVDAYKKNNLILIDAYHPARKGGEDGGYDYVTSIIEAYREALI